MRFLGTAFHRRSADNQRRERNVAPVTTPRRNVRGPQDWYEGGMPLTSGERSWMPQIVQDVRFDMNFVARRELMRKARYAAMNIPLVKRILEVDATYTIGPECPHLSPSSSDIEWNKAAKDVWAELTDSCGLHGENLIELLQESFIAERTDGEIFPIFTRRAWTDSELKTRGRKAGLVTGSRPVIQTVEAHRVETPFGRWGDEGKTIVDGVQVEKMIVDGRANMRPVGYWVRSSSSMFEVQDSWDLIPTSAIPVICERQRPGQIRAISAFYAAMNLLHDLDDLQMLEMRGAKDGAEKSTIIKTPAGELNAANLIRQRFGGQGGDAAAGVDEKDWRERTAFYQKTLGGRTIAVKTGDEVSQYLNNRPTVTSREYWLFLISLACATLGVSVLLVFPDFSDNTQGTAVRAELDIANRIFIRKGRKWRKFITDAWEYLIGWAIKNDARLKNAPDDWRNITIYQPRAVNVDAERNSNAMMQELEAGATDYELIYGPLGLDWRDRMDKLAEQQKYAKSIGLQLQVGQPQPLPMEQGDDNNTPKTSKGKSEKDGV